MERVEYLSLTFWFCLFTCLLILGAGTALLGEKSAMACTIAVEELIGKHYNDQIIQLVEDDQQAHKDLLKVLILLLLFYLKYIVLYCADTISASRRGTRAPR